MKKFLMFTTLLLALTACNNNSNNAQNNEKQSLVNVKNSYIEEVDRKTGQEVSKRLVVLATSMPNVHDATAVVIGR